MHGKRQIRRRKTLIRSSPKQKPLTWEIMVRALAKGFEGVTISSGVCVLDWEWRGEGIDFVEIGDKGGIDVERRLGGE
ncbi:predicted protein [Sclerotinia sclerotiorum 1980 UF-70]|uniref:Uncharacterized protein n=1 Tax=Sclerotinia sclerotiorum (strain ATCC 18683 / 1980 / Ss-1) TaxID=665079 RepID=A7EWJ6_SCLS1|nr:predicted protein [Sclerotinia sclerotiorum 1980 UF-70]EDN93838.1 predicted protein [Sclerotinia sclerotiorum 1980 UF-70]